MKYRNFDPNTNQPTTPSQLLATISHSTDNEKLTNLNHLLNFSSPSILPSSYNKIANTINSKIIKSKRKAKNKSKKILSIHTESIKEFDTYLNNKYPLSKLQNNAKFSSLLKNKLKEKLL